MKIQFGGLITDGRGSMGGSTFSRNGSGAYVRLKVTPVNPNTPAQANARANFGANSKAWGAVLSDAQRQGWKSLAQNFPVNDIFGNSVILSGNVLYGKVNNVLRNLGLSAISDPPIDLSVTALETLAVTAAEALSTIDIAFTVTPLPANHQLYIFASGNLPPGVNFYKNKLRYVGTSAAAQASPFDAGAEWELLFGELTAGNRFGIAVATVNTLNGAVSTAFQAIVTVG